MAGIVRRVGVARDAAGLTVSEVLVASVVLVLAASAAFMLLAAATKNAQRAQGTQIALDLAQEEMERLRAVPFDSLAIDRVPVAEAGEPLSPNSRVNGQTFAVKRTPPGEPKALVVNSDGFGFSPESEIVPGSEISGKIYRYVVWRADCEPTCASGSEDGREYKQLIVAVKPNRAVNNEGERGYVEVQSDMVDPSAYEGAPPPSGSPPVIGDGVTAQQFFLSDTPCSQSGTTTRKDIAGDHLLHNTLGTCASGPQNGPSKPGAPDALLLAGPPDPDPLDDLNPLLYDYSDDTYLEPTPDTDKGVQIRRDDAPGCYFNPTGATNPESQVHRWVSDPLPADFEAGEKLTLEFYTRTLNDALYPGRLCVYVFEREESGSPAVAEDTLLTASGTGNAYWTYEPEGTDYWPRNFWTRVRVPLEYENSPRTIAKGNRLGLALGVDREMTPAEAIPIMYDHPNYPSRLEVETETPIVGG